MGLLLRRAAIDSDQPETPAQLHAFFGRLGFSVATRAVMPGMTAPMEALWHIYRRTWPVLQLMGGRGSGKTRGLSLVEAAKAKFHPGYSIAHIGATKAQAMRCYGYFRETWAPVAASRATSGRRGSPTPCGATARTWRCCRGR